MNREKPQVGAKLVAATITIISIIFISYVDYSKASDYPNHGPEKMTLDGGSRGKVPFGHRVHQEKLDDCSICHSIFPKKPGSIEDLKKKGDLNKKQVMKKLCIKCHKAERMAGNTHGPTTCSKCHVR